VRFHSFQCIGLWFAALVFGAALRVAGVLLFFVPLLGHLVVLLLSMVVSLGFFVIWVVMIVKSAAGRDVEASGDRRFCTTANCSDLNLSMRQLIDCLSSDFLVFAATVAGQVRASAT